MDLDYIVDHITAEDVAVLVAKLATEFPECSDLFRSKCGECNWESPGKNDITQPDPDEQYFICIEALQYEVGRVKMLVELKRVFNLSYKEVQAITLPYIYWYPKYTSRKKVLSDLMEFLSCGINCYMHIGVVDE